MSLFLKKALNKSSKFPLSRNSKSWVARYIEKYYLFNIYIVLVKYLSFGQINMKLLMVPTQVEYGNPWSNFSWVNWATLGKLIGLIFNIVQK